MNQSFGPVNLSNSSLGSYSTSKASASSRRTRGEYRMAPNRKSSHESALNCCETTLHLYSVFRAVLLHIDFFYLHRGRFPTALEPVAVDLIAAKRTGLDSTANRPMRSVIRSTKHEFFPQARRDQACPPEGSQKHPHRLNPIMPTAGIVAVSGTKNCGVERHGRQPVA